MRGGRNYSILHKSGSTKSLKISLIGLMSFGVGMSDYRVSVVVIDRSGKRLDEHLIESDDYGDAMLRLRNWASGSFLRKDL